MRYYLRKNRDAESDDERVINWVWPKVQCLIQNFERQSTVALCIMGNHLAAYYTVLPTTFRGY